VAHLRLGDPKRAIEAPLHHEQPRYQHTRVSVDAVDLAEVLAKSDGDPTQSSRSPARGGPRALLDAMRFATFVSAVAHRQRRAPGSADWRFSSRNDCSDWRTLDGTDQLSGAL
jgi:hypothetical protein